ncbi:2-amino-4-hydroxy-6-hydroxymethyldihydropteridine diphosphokinase [Halieaceae bacterium IMCC14734]|uniref:2-amino-4-hydroxy-6-hydroxymethyldihydropteridine diphosphokinase n=1 Tax=Candidatus Litorirhabdus singularis TaxID=2518993 RepID=A0ABT3TM43_9GAMM|nr:2-amino-4-hydroxy-6-hydroxymethyldihydropteridine diphosphokinase [Candidatus Litorirhabdus singularis]MCX2983365.1 2-amino-4-hydroxy-6-hydroxymethyldihydropteridine diphosphokinase [Candidatus Litorirhabdus singularis]
MALISLNVGSNIDRENQLRAGVKALRAKFGELQLSSVYESAAVGFSGEAFLNLGVVLSSSLPLAELASWLRELEYAHGRPADAGPRSARTLDIDILTFDDLVGRFGKVELPRPEILFNAHVLGPMAELQPAVLHPVEGISYARLWEQYEYQGRVRTIPFNWQG